MWYRPTPSSTYLKVVGDLEHSGDGAFCILKAYPCPRHPIKVGVPGHQTSASVTFSLSNQLLTYKGGMMIAITDASNPVPVGSYPIQIPDFPHPLGNNYLHKTDYALTWFYLGYGKATSGSKDRYLHPGRVSEGCITVDPAAWTQLYKYLITSRSGDATNVGKLTVVA